jgi:hypothetical protein
MTITEAEIAVRRLAEIEAFFAAMETYRSGDLYSRRVCGFHRHWLMIADPQNQRIGQLLWTWKAAFSPE